MPSSNFANDYIGSAAEDKFLPALHHAVSGSAGSLISTCALYPLSLVVTRLQAQGQHHRRDGGRAGAAAAGAGDRKGRDTTTTSPSGRGAATDPARDPTYAGIAEAFSRIWSSGGGPKAFYTGLGQDAARSVLDSFLFFLFYEWIRSTRLSSRGRRGGGEKSMLGLGALEELVVGVIAGACTRFFTTPLANVVTRKQTGSLADGGLSARAVIDTIRREKGVTGLWSGYSANMILSLNPGITFLLQDVLKRKALAAERWDSPGPAATFLLAAVSKAVASTITYPFQTAMTRIQAGISVPAERGRKDAEKGGKQADADASRDKKEEAEASKEEAPKEGEGAASVEGEAPASEETVSPKTVEPVTTHNVAPPERNSTDESKLEAQALRAVKSLGEHSIFGTVARIARTEGVGSLYEGLQGELLKVFLGHGTAMLAKDVVHKLLFRLYFIAAGVLAELRARRANRAAGAGAKAPPTVRVTETTVVEEVIRQAPAPIQTPVAAAVEAPKLAPEIPTPMPSPPPSAVSPPESRLALPPPSTPTSLPSASAESSLVSAPPPAYSPPSPPYSQPEPTYAQPQQRLLPPPPAYTPPSPPEPEGSFPPRPVYNPPPPSSLAPPLPPPPPPQQPRQQLRAMRYRLDNEDEWGPRQAPVPAVAPSSARKQFDDFVVGVVANMIDKTQREIKH
ncbi:mitochondrial carrier domain-containing protein [Jackrogersella minutella]|nr:mitochondrial carrier domain-containing protein [Jackrogersella minutella]